jgi:hypothetical protein
VGFQAYIQGEGLEIMHTNRMPDENVLVIDVPGTLGGGTVIFTNTDIHFKDKRILYQDVESMSFYALHRSVNLIPVSQSYSFMIASASSKISFSIGTSLHIGKKAKQEAWAKVVAVSMQLLAPIIVMKLVQRIFEKNQTIKIGGVTFSREGFSKSGIFGSGKTVLWSEEIYIPKMQSGEVILFKDKGGKGRVFATVKTSVPNSVVIPDLVQAC